MAVGTTILCSLCVIFFAGVHGGCSVVYISAVSGEMLHENRIGAAPYTLLSTWFQWIDICGCLTAAYVLLLLLYVGHATIIRGIYLSFCSTCSRAAPVCRSTVNFELTLI